MSFKDTSCVVLKQILYLIEKTISISQIYVVVCDTNVKKKKTDINGNLCSYVQECVCVNIYTCKQKLVIRDKSREKLCRIHFFFQIECYIFVTRKRTQLLVLYSIHMVSRPYICTYIQVIWSSCNTNKNRLKMPSPFMF